MTGTLRLTWYNMPYLRNVLQMGQILVFRSRVVKKKRPADHGASGGVHTWNSTGASCIPCSRCGQTKGLGNKAITRAIQQALEQRQMEREYLPEELRSRYELAEYNYAIEHVHFPTDKELLLPENAWCLMSFCSFCFPCAA